ncbi:hypothetical protein P872_16265 [Rhodonellum psychrophilum GCM71 = DSM 17998]|uniref:Uncharacterized protein n=1 Tax=Rhodonellum psychrophilum GCM71 = DSM 17998 TaxID=1123057 RepID=U5C002_9BACT|nr:hypothetical protein P872_16265 [Rhodonellum psychrophilum GCM71 = DSM 17998]
MSLDWEALSDVLHPEGLFLSIWTRTNRDYKFIGITLYFGLKF